jgi:hypothetical protein
MSVYYGHNTDDWQNLQSYSTYFMIKYDNKFLFYLIYNVLTKFTDKLTNNNQVAEGSHF